MLTMIEIVSAATWINQPHSTIKLHVTY